MDVVALNHVTVVHDPDENDVSPFPFLISAAQKLDDVPFLRTEIKESLEGILMSALVNPPASFQKKFLSFLDSFRLSS